MEMGCIGSLQLMADPLKIVLGLVSVSIAVLMLLVLKKANLSTRSRIVLIYFHLSALFFPFVLFSINTTCGMLCMSCYNKMFMLIGYALPTTLLISIATGFVVIPSLFILTNKKTEINGTWIAGFVKKYSALLRIKQPKVYAVDKPKPLAFSFRSFRSALFLSVGLLELLNRKETEAVLLHELAHIRQTSSVLKLSNILLRLFSPISMLIWQGNSDGEESMADDFVFEAQKTWKHLLSAKKKMEMYEKNSN